MLDPVKNFAKVTVSLGYDSQDTSIVLIEFDGDKLPDPSTDRAFNLVWWNITDYPDPLDDPNVEIVRCTAKTDDTLTIIRAQESTTAATHNIPGKTYKMILTLTKKMIDDIRNCPGWIDVRLYASINAACTDTLTLNKAIIVTNNQPLADNLIVENRTIIIAPKTGSITSATRTLTFGTGSHFVNLDPLHYCFIGFNPEDINFTAGSIEEVRPEMFGCVGDGVTDDITAFQCALDSIATYGGTTFRTRDGKTYKFNTGQGQSSHVYLRGSNITFEFGTSKFIGCVLYGGKWTGIGYEGSPKKSDVVINGGIYAPTTTASNPTNRYEAYSVGLAIILGARIQINNPKFLVTGSTRAIAIQTVDSIWLAPFNNINEVTINNPIIIGDTLTQDGIDISCSGPYNNMIQDVTINNPIVVNTMRAVQIIHNTDGYAMERIHVNNILANGISDTAILVQGAHYCTVTGKVQNIGWMGLYTYRADFSSFDLDVHGVPGLAIPPFSVGEIAAYPRYSVDPTGAYIQSGLSPFNPVFFKNLFISGYSSDYKWPTGIIAHAKNAIYGNVVLRDCEDGIDNVDSCQSVWGSVVMSSVTTPLKNAINKEDWYGQIVAPGDPPTLYDRKEILLSTTTVAFDANGDTTLYSVPAGVRCVLTKAIVIAGASAGATTTLSIGKDTTETDFIPANTLSNLDAEYDSVILMPIPNTTPLKNRSYPPGSAIEARVANKSGGPTNTLYLYGFLY